MTPLGLSRWQFGITTIYHFFFVPLTLGLSILLVIMETMYVRTGDERYKRMTKFWGKLFLINFAMGVVTGLVQEFQFGMNWASYSRFVGDIFGVPLAIEALLAFFLESTFLGIWIFGWDKLPKAVHAATMWLVAIGASLSALWILIANSFMQEPVGYVLRNGRAELADFGALLTNPHVWVQYPHVLFSGLATAGFFVLGISAYHLLRKGSEHEMFKRSFAIATVTVLVASVLVGMAGHAQAQHMVATQPMKMAAAEALWESEDPAPMSLFTIGNEPERRDVFAIKIPALLSLLSYNRLSGEVKGINNLQVEYEQTYGPGNYLPPIAITYWAFRFMFLPGLLMIGIGAVCLYLLLRRKVDRAGWLLRLLPLAIALPYVANTAGWILTEMGRQPWIVFGLQRTADAVSPTATVGAVLISLLAFTLLYGVLMGVDIFLLSRFARSPRGQLDVPLETPAGPLGEPAEAKGGAGWI